MANRVRINVKFGDTKLLVPCGDGSIAVNELINKAVGRFKKHRKLVREMNKIDSIGSLVNVVNDSCISSEFSI